MHPEQLMNILYFSRDKNHDGVGYFVTAHTAHSNTVRILVEIEIELVVETLDSSSPGTGLKQAGLSLPIHSFVTDIQLTGIFSLPV